MTNDPTQLREQQANPDEKLDLLLARINSIAQGGQVAAPPKPPAREEIEQVIAPTTAPPAKPSAPEPQTVEPRRKEFIPTAPSSFREAKLSEGQVEELVLKFLLSKAESSGRQIAEQIRLPFILIEKFLHKLKNEQSLAYVGQASLNDYMCRLTEKGAAKARSYSQSCTYFGSAPVCLHEYIRSVKAQSIEGSYPTKDVLQQSFNDLLIEESMLARLGPAISSGRGMFLYGYPGNGKTSIAERVCKSFGPYIWIPRALAVDGEIIRLFDPMSHEVAPLEESDQLIKDDNIDQRWIRIKRPTIVVGGELTMEHLEITFNSDTGISEAPVQLKSNCGILVIDDFGRQKMRVDELLNRWIVPLEKRYDFLNLSSGKKIQVPFDQLVIFSTNLEPRDLVDDAFMRRIPYKIEVPDPSRENFVKLFGIMCKILDVPYCEKSVQYLITKHYEPTNRPFRNCQPRDLLLQIRNYCNYNKLPVLMSEESFDFAADCYFSVL